VKNTWIRQMIGNDTKHGLLHLLGHQQQ